MELWQWDCRKCEVKKKKKEQNCGNGIAEIGGKIVTIVAMALLKMGEKKKFVVPKSGESKKKKVLRSQYFHNKLHVISYYQFKFEFNTEITFLIQQ